MKKKVFFEEFGSLYYFHGATQNWKMQGFHFHKQYEILLFMCEGAKLEIKNRIYNVKKGDIFFINNTEYHRTEGKEGEEYKRYVLMFEPESVAQMSLGFGFNFTALFEEYQEEYINHLHLTGQNLKIVEAKMQQVEDSISKDTTDIYNKNQVKLQLLDLLNTLNQLFDSFVKTEKDKRQVAVSETAGDGERMIPYRNRIEEIKKYIVEHIEEKLELDDLAEVFFINRYYLSHYFKKETGFTLNQYITNQKIMAAKKMLRSGMSVTEAALRLSYNSDSHFISTFKKMTGITPGKFAKGKNGNNV